MDLTCKKSIKKYQLSATRLTDTYRTFNQKATFFSSLPGKDSGGPQMGHKTSLDTFKENEIILGIFFQLQCYITRNKKPERKWKNGKTC